MLLKALNMSYLHAFFEPSLVLSRIVMPILEKVGFWLKTVVDHILGAIKPTILEFERSVIMERVCILELSRRKVQSGQVAWWSSFYLWCSSSWSDFYNGFLALMSNSESSILGHDFSPLSDYLMISIVVRQSELCKYLVRLTASWAICSSPFVLCCDPIFNFKFSCFPKWLSSAPGNRKVSTINLDPTVHLCFLSWPTYISLFVETCHICIVQNCIFGNLQILGSRSVLLYLFNSKFS